MGSNRKVALVTGGARRLGRHISLALAGRGYAVAVNHSSSDNQAGRTVEDIRAAGGEAVALRADVADPAQVASMAAEAEARMGPVALLVNSAAVIPPSSFAQLTPEVWRATLSVNLDGTFHCCRELGQRMMERGSGAIVNIACLGAFQPWHKHIAYSVSKAGVVMLTRCLAKALAPAVRVNAVAPGTVELADEPAPTPITPRVESIPMQRYAVPSDIAGAVVFLAEGTGYITGQTLLVDGGTSLQSIW
jgi:NAD(P)-dependent dehydrogenase (short-subunit alcohol dehydrogenase family)